jgi:outer membrane biosynthesis protein TonB
VPVASASASSGLLNKDSVRQVIRDRYSEIRACYETQLKKQPNLHGTVVARFMVNEDGTVASVDMSSSKLPAKSVVECAGKIFSTMRFPPPPNGMILITYPIELMPEVTTEWK